MSVHDSRIFRWNLDELDDKDIRVYCRNLLVALVVFLSFVLLLICLRRARRRRQVDSDYCGGNGLDAEAVKRLPVRLHRGEEAVCSICLGVVADGEKVRALPGCCHGFHPDCVDQWLRKQSSCPLCRAKVVCGGAEKDSKPPPPPLPPPRVAEEMV
ncbi:hypothetical protein HPP92_017932 [Vanilla planifolia]|uniref:RING-type domain-containing protein n=1 Tax=Vanilla planifolia TaxID=51239 RepID=A0A835QBU5_VANPL|nr:hypothetical protein HPP92_017932 [Vanilla planifolia]